MSEVPLYMPKRLQTHADRIRGETPQRPLHTVSDRTHSPGGVRSFWGPKFGPPNLTRFAPQKALNFIARGKLTSYERVVRLHVGTGVPHWQENAPP